MVASVSGTVAIFTVILLIILCARRKRLKRPPSSDAGSLEMDNWKEVNTTTGMYGHGGKPSGPIGGGSIGHDQRAQARIAKRRQLPPITTQFSPVGLQHDVAPPLMMHPPQGYTRPARLKPSSSRSNRTSYEAMQKRISLVGPPPLEEEPSSKEENHKVYHHQPHASQQAAVTRGSTGGGRGHDTLSFGAVHDPNRRDSLFLPTSTSHPPPIRQSQSVIHHPHRHQQSLHAYQPYKPFTGRYQLSDSIPEEVDPTTTTTTTTLVNEDGGYSQGQVQGSSTVGPPDLSVSRPYLPGERTRSPVMSDDNDDDGEALPASLAVGGVGGPGRLVPAATINFSNHDQQRQQQQRRERRRRSIS